MAHPNTGEGVDEVIDPFETEWSIRGGAVAGTIATIVMGILITATDVETLSVGIAGLYGFSGNLFVGWLAHLIHGALFGVLFAMLMADPGLQGLTYHRGKVLAAGLTYGLVLAVIGAGLIMPMWLLTIQGAPQPPIPHVTLSTLGWHLVYGFVLAAVFPSLEGR